jgi:RNA-binding protein NOB1
LKPRVFFFVLRLCKNPEKRFCPSCGGPTLLRTSITYVPSTPQNPQGYILHLKQNYNYRLRGTQYSLPTPQMGKAGGQNKKTEPVLREDQKEWIKGVKSNEVRQFKEQRAMVKAVLEEEKKGKGKQRAQGGGGGSSSTGFFQGAGGAYGLESAMLGMAGPKGGIEHQKGRRRGGKNGAGGETRLDSSGLPVIGMGRKNPNESRRRR